MKNEFKDMVGVQPETVIANEIMDTDDIARPTQASIEVFTNPKQAFYSSIKQDGSREQSIKLYNAINSGDDSLSDNIGKVLEITDMVAHPITLTDEVTGDVIDALRTVLIGKDNKAYASVSLGVVSSLQKILPIVGQAPWEPALKIKPTQVKTRKGFKTLTLALEL